MPRDQEPSRLMKIAAFAQATGLPRSTIHHYRNLGLLPPPQVLGPKKHLYGEEHLGRAAEIRRLVGEGLALREVKKRLEKRRTRRTVASAPLSSVKDRILDEATQLFVDQGYEAVSIESVAARVRIGKATLYRHFPSKTELFVECLERLRFTIFTEEERRAFRSDERNEARLRATLVLSRFRHYRMMENLLLLAGESRDRNLAHRAREALHRMVTNVEPVIARAIRAGAARPLDTELASYATWGALLALGDRMALDDRYTEAEIVDFYLDFAARGLSP